MLINELHIAIGEPSVSEISNAALQQCVDFSIREFSRFQGAIKMDTTLTTSVNQQEYDISSITDLVTIVDVFWMENPFSSITDSSFDSPSLRKIYDYKRAQYLKKYTGLWEKRDKTLFLMPAPTTVQTMVIVYRSMYTESTLSREQKDTVLLYAEFLARKILIGYDIIAKVGAVSTDKKTMWQIATALRDDFYRKVK